MRDFFDYLREHKLVWLIPLLLLVLVIGVLAWKVASTPGTPFIYDM